MACDLELKRWNAGACCSCVWSCRKRKSRQTPSLGVALLTRVERQASETRKRLLLNSFSSSSQVRSKSNPLCRPSNLRPDRKSTRLNSSHLVISYAVFCLKKKKNKIIIYNVN